MYQSYVEYKYCTEKVFPMYAKDLDNVCSYAGGRLVVLSQPVKQYQVNEFGW